MSTRERMTWGGKSAAGPTLPFEAAAKKKRGSAHPQTPDEGLVHPAAYEDPTQPDDYENGDTSSWAEDPMGPPYRTSLQPANPMDDGGYRHPAAQAGAPARNASRSLRAAAELKAHKCIRLASALLGDKIVKAAEANDVVATEMIESQALAFMNLSDAHIASSLLRVEAATEDEEVLLRKMLAEDAGEDDEDTEDDESMGKEASDDVSLKLAEVTSALASLQAQIAGLAGAPKRAEADVEAEDEDEALLASMLAAESEMAGEVEAEDVEAEEMLQAMLAEEREAPVAEAPAKASKKTLAEFMDMDDEFDINMDSIEDPMGLMDDEDSFPDSDDLLMNLYASNKKAEEEEEEEEEVRETKEASNRRTASRLRPQARKPTTGVQSVGNVRVASGSNDTNELAKLWNSAPDVSRVFNS